MKGSTFYRDGSREDKTSDDPADWTLEPQKPVRLDTVDELLLSWEGEIDMEATQEELNAFECVGGVCEIPSLAV